MEREGGKEGERERESDWEEMSQFLCEVALPHSVAVALVLVTTDLYKCLSTELAGSAVLCVLTQGGFGVYIVQHVYSNCAQNNYHFAIIIIIMPLLQASQNKQFYLSCIPLFVLCTLIHVQVLVVY